MSEEKPFDPSARTIAGNWDPPAHDLKPLAADPALAFSRADLKRPPRDGGQRG